MQKRSLSLLLRRVTALATMGALPLAVGCAGKVVSLGSTNEPLSTIDPNAVGGSVGACPTGYAHPNICCSGGPNEASSCGAYVEHPFHACPSGSSTYPNPLTCCSLADGTTCIDTPTSGNLPPTPPPYGCGYMCPPGWWSPSDVPPTPDQGSCCHVNASGAQECYGWASAAPTKTTPVACISDGGIGPTDAGVPVPVDVDGGAAPGANGSGKATPPSTVDAGSDPNGNNGASGGSSGGTTGTPDCPPDPGTGGDPGFDGGVTGLCSPCPDGWVMDPNAPDLCCVVDSSGNPKECFSQATGAVGGSSGGGSAGTSPSGGPTAVDAGAPTTPTACSGTDTECSCKGDVGGVPYAIDCQVTDTGSTCTCSDLSSAVSTQPAMVFTSNICTADPTSLLTLCKTH